jgi:serine/threonine protein kinase
MLSPSAHLDLISKQLQNRGLRLAEELGTGTFAAVYRVVDRAGKGYALKVILPPANGAQTGSGPSTCMEDQNFTTERQIHSTVCGHRNIVTLHDSFTINGLHCLLLDLHTGGTLLDTASSTPRFWRNDAEIKRVFTQLINAVAHCHSLGISHRDLKPENILVDAANGDVIVADFGLATSSATDIVSGAGSEPYKSPGITLSPPSWLHADQLAALKTRSPERLKKYTTRARLIFGRWARS